MKCLNCGIELTGYDNPFCDECDGRLTVERKMELLDKQFSLLGVPPL